METLLQLGKVISRIKIVVVSGLEAIGQSIISYRILIGVEISVGTLS